MSVASGALPREYVAVIRLAKQYVVAHVSEERTVFISQHSGTNLKIAQVAATAFAESKKLFRQVGCMEFAAPIITVIRKEGKWFPAELHPDRVVLLLGGSQEEATRMAGRIALERNISFVFSDNSWQGEISPPLF